MINPPREDIPDACGMLDRHTHSALHTPADWCPKPPGGLAERSTLRELQEDGAWLKGSSQDGCEAARQAFTPHGGLEAPHCCLKHPYPCLESPWHPRFPLAPENWGHLPRRLGCGWRCRRAVWSAGPPRTLGILAGRLTRTVREWHWQEPGGRRPSPLGTARPAGHTRPNPMQGSGPRTCRGKLGQ